MTGKIMRVIEAGLIRQRIKDEFINANYHLNQDIKDALSNAMQTETDERAKDILKVLTDNYKKADEGVFPICQDTGVAVVFCEIGDEINLSGINLKEIINEAVSEAYTEGFLRKSMVSDPIFSRINTKNNTPAICHFDFVKGDKLTLYVMPKGGGSENMSIVSMLKPADGVDGLKELLINRIRTAGGSPCPPLVIGIGIGGNFETCALLAKKSLLRELNEKNPDEKLAGLEAELLELVNQSGVGPMGLGGKTTALSVNILSMPCHIASLPVAINIECHAHRYKKIEI